MQGQLCGVPVITYSHTVNICTSSHMPRARTCPVRVCKGVIYCVTCDIHTHVLPHHIHRLSVHQHIWWRMVHTCLTHKEDTQARHSSQCILHHTLCTMQSPSCHDNPANLHSCWFVPTSRTVCASMQTSFQYPSETLLMIWDCMLTYIVLCCRMVSMLLSNIVLYCIILYCIVLYCLVLYCIVLYCNSIVLYRIVLYIVYCIVL